MRFSVLISAYRTEIPIILDRALKSIWDDQVLKPNEIVLVKDGPLTVELDYLIKTWSIRLGEVMKLVTLEKNIGLGDALGIGIKECKYDIVARMDTDDISLPHRFSTQISYLKKNPQKHVKPARNRNNFGTLSGTICGSRPVKALPIVLL